MSILAVLIASVSSTVEAGQDLTWDIQAPTDDRGAAIVINVGKPVAEISIRLSRSASDGSSEEIELRPALRVGRPNVVLLPQRQGTSVWTGSMEVNFADGSHGRAPLSFQTAWASAMTMSEAVTPDDLAARRVVVRANHPATKAVVTVTGEAGRLGGTEVDLQGAAPGSPLHIAWEQPVEGDPLVIELVVHSVHGVTASRTWRPWQVHIPHETVEFDTGRAEIRPDQVHKLEGVLGELRSALSRHGTVVEASLWIAGHTDTVGPRANNQRLSEARARAIASWFRHAGLRVPIHYRGFGQDSLMVRTADNVDEPRNRRAEYIVSADDPYAGRTDIPGKWQRLP